MKLLRTTDRPEQKYTLAFVGYRRRSDGAEIELTYNYGVDRYELGNAFGHIAVAVADAAAACESVRAKGGKVTREAGPVKGGTTVIAFVEDPGRLQDRADRAQRGHARRTLRLRAMRSKCAREAGGVESGKRRAAALEMIAGSAQGARDRRTARAGSAAYSASDSHDELGQPDRVAQARAHAARERRRRGT